MRRKYTLYGEKIGVIISKRDKKCKTTSVIIVLYSIQVLYETGYDINKKKKTGFIYIYFSRNYYVY